MNASPEEYVHCPVPPEGPPPCDPAAIEPVATFLRDNQPVEAPVVFPRGTVLPDGRLDLCKQSLGPAGCRLITTALEENQGVVSLLLGTNGTGERRMWRG